MSRVRGLALRLLDLASAPIRHAVGRSRCAILVYHSVSPPRFEAHVRRLRKLYNIVPYEQLVDAIERRDWSGMPSRPLVIHFDDGLREFAELEPVLRRHRVPVVQFLLAEFVGTRRHGWWTTLERRQVNQLKRVPDRLRLALLEERSGWTPTREYPERQFLSLDEVERLRAAGVTFGAHTLTHPQLEHCDEETAWREIAEGRSRLESLLGAPVEHFAYPSGGYSEEVVTLVRRAGFRSARTMDRGWNGIGTDVLRLRDLEGADDIPPDHVGHLELISLAHRGWRGLGLLRNRLVPRSGPLDILAEEGSIPEPARPPASLADPRRGGTA